MQRSDWPDTRSARGACDLQARHRFQEYKSLSKAHESFFPFSSHNCWLGWDFLFILLLLIINFFHLEKLLPVV